MRFNHPSKAPQSLLSWIEWVVAIGVVGLALSLVIYAYILLKY
jgi:hypothetical protein